MRIAKPFSNLMMLCVFLVGLVGIWTDQSPSELYQSAKDMIVATNLLSFDQKITVNHVIRRAEEAWTEYFGKKKIPAEAAIVTEEESE
jgi:hypothetical protein